MLMVSRSVWHGAAGAVQEDQRACRSQGERNLCRSTFLTVSGLSAPDLASSGCVCLAGLGDRVPVGYVPPSAAISRRNASGQPVLP